MTPTDRKHFHGLLNLLGRDKADVVAFVTDGRTESSSSMTQAECDRAINLLKLDAKDRFGKSRGKVIHLCCLCGMVLADGSPDYRRIDGWVAKQKAANPRGRALHWLRGGELNQVVTVAEAMYRTSLKPQNRPA